MEDVTLKDVLNVVLDVKKEIKQEINEVKNEMREMKQELNQRMDIMQEDMNNMQEDMKNMKEDMNNMKEDINDMKIDMKVMKQDIEEMDKLGLIKEYIILRLRLKEGINLSEFKSKFKQDIYELYKDKIDTLITQGLLEKVEDTLRLTYKGEDLANMVWKEFV